MENNISEEEQKQRIRRISTIIEALSDQSERFNTLTNTFLNSKKTAEDENFHNDVKRVQQNYGILMDNFQLVRNEWTSCATFCVQNARLTPTDECERLKFVSDEANKSLFQARFLFDTVEKLPGRSGGLSAIWEKMKSLV